MSVSTCTGDISRVAKNTCVLFFFAGLIASGAAVADVKAIVVNGLGNDKVFLSDINNKSQAVGSGIVESTGEEHALVWEDGESMDLGTLGGPCSTATAIDEGGEHIVGYSDTPSSPDCFLNSHAFIWRNGMMTDLGTL
jgi:probable HAF family extracellular repeat protein